MENSLEGLYIGFCVFIFCVAISFLISSNRCLNQVMDKEKYVIYRNNVVSVYGGMN